MATEYDDDSKELDDLIRREKIGLEAQEKWSDAMARVADAAEHGAMMNIAMMLTGMGLQAGNPPGVKHRVSCPCCIMIRDAKKAPLVSPGGDLGAIIANGNGRRK